jgi:hypothetical protein
MAFYKFIMQERFLIKFRQMEEMFAVLHCTQQEICVIVQAVGRI